MDLLLVVAGILLQSGFISSSEIVCKSIMGCEECILNSECFYFKSKSNTFQCAPKSNYLNIQNLIRTTYRNTKECQRAVKRIQSDIPIVNSGISDVPTPHRPDVPQNFLPIPVSDASFSTTTISHIHMDPDHPTPKPITESRDIIASTDYPDLPATTMFPFHPVDDQLPTKGISKLNEENLIPIPGTTTSNIMEADIEESTETSHTTAEQGEVETTTTTATRESDTDKPRKIYMSYPNVPASVKFPLTFSPNPNITTGLMGMNQQVDGASIDLDCRGWDPRSHILQLQLAACRLVNLSTRESSPVFKRYMRFAMANPMLNNSGKCILLHYQKKNC